MKNLQLNFEASISVSDDTLEQMVKELKEASPVKFTHKIGSPSFRDVSTKPEYLTIDKQVLLTFKDDGEARQFMRTNECRDIYDSYAKGKN